MEEEEQERQFGTLVRLCEAVAAVASYSDKTALCARLFSPLVRRQEGPTLYLMLKLLLAKEDSRVYRLRDKQLVKLFAALFSANHSEMLADLDKGDISETARQFFERSGKAAEVSTITLQEVDDWLTELATMTKDEERIPHFRKVLSTLTPSDLKLLVKLIDHDLKINLGAKFVLEALHPKAFEAFKNSHNLKRVVDKVLSHTLDTADSAAASSSSSSAAAASRPGLKKQFSTNITLFNPIKPMLAKPFKTFEEIWSRCPRGAFAEVKYDGERVQIHKQGEKYQYFSRNLKAVAEHKVQDLKDYIPQAMVAEDIILDAEILLCEASTNKPLPFGSLGIHKKKGFADATICIFIFDILYVDGEDLMSQPYSARRQRLQHLVKEIPGHVRLSEAFELKSDDDLGPLWNRVLKEGLEGLMIKAADGVYNPGARHWGKLKKDYLGGMADSADLIVLGANYGSGNKGGLRSSFLMGVYDGSSKRFKTVCKCANGFDDATLAELQKLPMVKCTVDTVPDWLDVDRALVPQFVVPDPKRSPVWEIEGAQFTKSERHSAGGFSIRFPRLARFRDDKDWTTATSLQELIELAQTSIAVSEGKASAADDDADENEDKKPPKALSKSSVPVAAGTTPTKPAKKSSAAISAPKGIESFFKPKAAPTDRHFMFEAPSKLKYVVGDVTDPLGDKQKTRVILHFVDDSGTWPDRGVFAAISTRFPKAEVAYKKNAAQLPLGESMLVRVKAALLDSSEGAIYVGLLVSLERPSSSSTLPQFNFDVLVPILQQNSEWAVGANVGSVHVARPRRDLPKMDWDQVERAFVESFVDKGIDVYVYSLEQHPEVASGPSSAKKRPLMVTEDDSSSPSTSSAPAPKRQKTHIEGLNEILSDCIVIFLGHVEKQNLLRALLLADGALVLPDGSNSAAATHAICEADAEDILEVYRAENPTLRIVTPQWIYDSVQRGSRLNEKLYSVGN